MINPHDVLQLALIILTITLMFAAAYEMGELEPYEPKKEVIIKCQAVGICNE